MEDNKDLSPEEQEKQQQENKNKVQKAFDSNIEKLTAILKKAPDKKKRKFSSDAMDNLLGELFKEEDEKLKEELKTELKGLLESYVSFWREVENKEREIEKVKQDQMKAFNDKANKLVNKIEGFPNLMKKYKEGLVQAASAPGNNPA